MKDKIDELIILRKKNKDLCVELLEVYTTMYDMYFLSIMDKNMRLIDGIIEMINIRNMACIGIILRTQMDNCMRLYAMYIAENRDEVMGTVFDENMRLNQIKDFNGNKMKDVYLKEELNKISPLFSTVYSKSSGYIHHSEKSFYSVVSKDASEKFVINFSVGHELDKKFDKIINEGVVAFIYFTELQFKLLKYEIEYKAKNVVK